ncbi:MAG: hypothetical protein HKN20_15770 [Gemmatimonadetes bacterium]|nr:hypothetical protein [Gemmatimonadota bacterium]
MRAGSVLAREGSHHAASLGMQIDENGRTGVRSLLALRRGRNRFTFEAALSKAGASLDSPVTRSAWADGIAERERAPSSFARAECERFLLQGSSVVLTAKIEFIRTDRRGWIVPVLASTWNALGQRFTAEAAYDRGAMAAIKWNAWPGGSQDLHRADRLLADIRALTEPGRSRSLRRW